VVGEDTIEVECEIGRSSLRHRDLGGERATTHRIVSGDERATESAASTRHESRAYVPQAAPSCGPCCAPAGEKRLIDSGGLPSGSRVALRLASPPIAIRSRRPTSTQRRSAPSPRRQTKLDEPARSRRLRVWMEIDGPARSRPQRPIIRTGSVGSFTHGFIDVAAAATRDDVEAVLAAGGWTSAVAALPHVPQRPREDRLRSARRGGW